MRHKHTRIEPALVKDIQDLSAVLQKLGIKSSFNAVTTIVLRIGLPHARRKFNNLKPQ